MHVSRSTPRKPSPNTKPMPIALYLPIQAIASAKLAQVLESATLARLTVNRLIGRFCLS